MKSILLVSVISLGTLTLTAQAKTDVAASMEHLKKNEENAKSNKQQYETNVDISSKNIVEVTAAIKKLREQKAQLASNSQNLDKNRAVLEKMRQKLADYSKEESALLKKEEAQIAQLRSTLEKLEANKKLREENISAYQLKIAEVEKEKSDWDSQKQAFSEIQKELNTKEAKALTERDKWLDKRKGYRGEAAKWDKEAEVAEQTRVKYEKLKN